MKTNKTYKLIILSAADCAAEEDCRLGLRRE